MLNRIIQKKQLKKPLDNLQEKRQMISLDRHGNAIPDVFKHADEGLSSAFRIVEKREIIVTYDDSKETTADLKAIERSLLERMMPWTGKNLTVQNSGNKPQPQQMTEVIVNAEQDVAQSRFAEAFQRLHAEFSHREQHLERRLDEVNALQKTLAQVVQPKQRFSPWLMFSLGAAAMFAFSYMLLVLTNMQNSMQGMSSDMASMNGHVGAMVSDTRAMNANTQAMSANIQTMNQSIHHLNGNVGQMNQQMGTISRAAEPMADMAVPMRPMTKMFRSFMPF